MVKYPINSNRFVKVDPQNPDAKVISFAAELIKTGGIVAFPTETVYGLGAHAQNEAAIVRIFEAKGRPKSDPIIVHISYFEQLFDVVANVPLVAGVLAKKFWPGPLTMIMKRSEKIPAIVSAGLDTVAVRMPNHPVALALLKATDAPIAAPSANLFTRPSPTTGEHVLEDLGDRVDLILDVGPTQFGIESTVINLMHDPPLILRPGAIEFEALSGHIPNVKTHVVLSSSDLPQVSPGTQLKHYSPRAKLYVVNGGSVEAIFVIGIIANQMLQKGKNVGLLLADEDLSYFQFNKNFSIASLGSSSNIQHIAKNLFAKIRDLDRSGVDVILTRDFGTRGLALAIQDRLVRAAEGKVINAKLAMANPDLEFLNPN
jgi:L-threonylcarbamoyladenylate synthase